MLLAAAGFTCVLLVVAVAFAHGVKSRAVTVDAFARTSVISVSQARVNGSVFILERVPCRRRGCPLRLLRAPFGSSRFERLPTPRATIDRGFDGGSVLDVAGSVAGAFFVSRRVGWLAGRALWFTTSGGRHWRRVPSPGRCRFTRVVGQSQRRVFALGSYCGRRRQSVLFGARVGTTSFKPLLRSAGSAFVSDRRVFVIRPEGLVYSTDDGETFGAPAATCGDPVFGDPVGDLERAVPAQRTSAVWALCHDPNRGKGQTAPSFSEISPDGAQPFVGRGRVPRAGPSVFTAIDDHTALLAGPSGPLTRTVDRGTVYRNVIPSPRRPQTWLELSVLPSGRGLARRGSGPHGPQSEVWISRNFGRSWSQIHPRTRASK